MSAGCRRRAWLGVWVAISIAAHGPLCALGWELPLTPPERLVELELLVAPRTPASTSPVERTPPSAPQGRHRPVVGRPAQDRAPHSGRGKPAAKASARRPAPRAAPSQDARGAPPEPSTPTLSLSMRAPPRLSELLPRSAALRPSRRQALDVPRTRSALRRLAGEGPRSLIRYAQVDQCARSHEAAAKRARRPQAGGKRRVWRGQRSSGGCCRGGAGCS